MSALWSLYLAVTRFFGARRRLVRRLAALCLVVLGVHAAADLIDDVVFRVIDALDLFVDGVAWQAIEQLAAWGSFSPAEGVEHAQAFAERVDIGEKDVAAKWLALLVELGVDLLLLDFVWGARGLTADEQAGTIVDELKASARELRDALFPLDLERLAAAPALAAFAVAGTFVAARAVEGFLADSLSATVPLWPFAPNASAGAAILVAALLLWRFLPDLLHGAIVRAHQRGEKARRREGDAPPTTRLMRARGVVRRVTRGALLAFALLPLALFGLSGQADVVALVARTGTGL